MRWLCHWILSRGGGGGYGQNFGRYAGWEDDNETKVNNKTICKGRWKRSTSQINNHNTKIQWKVVILRGSMGWLYHRVQWGGYAMHEVVMHRVFSMGGYATGFNGVVMPRGCMRWLYTGLHEMVIMRGSWGGYTTGLHKVVISHGSKHLEYERKISGN